MHKNFKLLYMKTSNVLLYLVVMSPLCLFAQLFIDGENASINNGNLRDNGRTILVQTEGSGWVHPWLSGFSRRGGKGIGFRIDGSRSGAKQRVEYPIIRWTSPQDVANNANRYTGFSFRLDTEVWSAPTKWFLIHQIQQVAVANQTGNFPFIALSIERNNMLRITSRNGRNGNTVRNPSPKVDARNIFQVQKGVWYDVVVGWKFSPYAPNGWVNVWIKTANENKYRMFGMNNIRIGYDQPARKILNNKIGIYRGTVNAANKIHFDEVRWAGFFDGAKLPGAAKKELSENLVSQDDAVFSQVSVYPNPWQNGPLFVQLPKIEENSSAQISVYSLLGKEIAKRQIDDSDLNLDILELQPELLNLNRPGLYIVKISGAGLDYTQKLTVE